MKQKIFHIILVLCMVATLLPVTSISAGADDMATDTMTNLYDDVVTKGGGAPISGYYSIGSAAELKYLADYVNCDHNTSGVTFCLTDNIDYSSTVSYCYYDKQMYSLRYRSRFWKIWGYYDDFFKRCG